MRRLGLWPVLCCMLLVLALPAWAAPNVEMTVQPANEGRVKQDGWVTVVVDLANQGAELSGQLVVELDAEFPHPQYVVDVALPAGGKKRIPVSLQASGNAPVKVQFLAGGKPVQSERVSLTWLAPQSALVGVLSGDELGIPALNQLQASQAQSAQVVRLSAATMPDRAALLEDFDLIALSRFDTATLSPEQLRALEVWVGRGGTLLLAGGPEWKRTMAPLPPALLPVEVTGVREVALNPLAELAGRELSGTGAVSEGRLLTGQGLLYADGVPLIATAAVGSGRVLYLAFDPGLTPLAGWAGQPALFNRLLGGLADGALMWQNERSWMIREALQQIPDWALPSVWIIAGLLISYLLLIGPANYLLLKRLDKREWSWGSVPALSILFIGLVYLLGFGRFQPLVSHLITVTELSQATGAATMNSYLGLYAPGRERITVPVADAHLVRPLESGPSRGLINARIVSGEQTSIELLGLTSYSMSGFSMEQDLRVQGGLEVVEAKLESGQLTGRLKNGLDQAVDEIYLSLGSTFHAVGRLEPGQLSEPFTIDLAAAALPYNPNGGPIRVVGGMAVPQYAGGDDDRRRILYDYVLEQQAPQTNGLLVTGWTEQPLTSPNLPELGKVVQGANLLLTRLPLPMGGESVEIPAGVILGRPVDPKGVDWVPNGYMLRPGTHSFTLLLPPVDPDQVGDLILDLRVSVDATTRVKAAVKNQETGEWLPLTEQSAPLPGWRAFVSPVGLLEVRYEATEHVEIQPPTVAVKGVAR